MRVFITGATGFIGMRLVPELIAHGHTVLGLARSEEKAAPLAALGAEIRLGSLEEPERLAGYAAEADAVVHLAFNHDFSRFAQNCEDDRRVIEAIGEALAGSGRIFVMTSGTALAVGADGTPATEDSPTLDPAVFARATSEGVALGFAARGVRVAVVRLPQVHDPRRQGLVSYAIRIAREKGMLAYVGEGRNRWPAAHLTDVARLYRLALERGADRAIYHAVAEEGVALRDMFETIAPQIGVPARSITADAAQAHYGWLANFVSHDITASSARTREALGWTPTGPTMLEDLGRLELD